ncbi:ead/Ea22-like family protein [Raoultella ornithinolytica]|uniref:ead/Ea22-like family protein n=1 Tax=Raoultella ornithinolytica TaxID=54291 RepID=UPI001D113CEE
MKTDITELAPAMKAAAEKATPGEWRRASTQFNGITATPFMLGRKEVMIACASEKRDAEFIALANPTNILALVEALEKAQAINAAAEKLVRCKGRYHGEQNYRALASLFGVNAPDLPPLDDESRTVTPVTYSENADADYCRKWAWEQVKGEVSTEDWTTGDNITYFGFFCWGWDMRRQYNEQRAATVKLPPKIERDDADGWFVHKGGRVGGGAAEWYNKALDDVGAELAAAGIKLEAE